MFRIVAMDHIVLNVEDMEAVLNFYINVLGLEGERLEDFRKGKVGFPSIRISADTVIDLFPAKEPKPITLGPYRSDLNHFCLVIDKEDMQKFIEHLKINGVVIEQGPGQNWGAKGTGISIYFRDPEKRQIEVRYYDKDIKIET
jgi:catechol 2,3-dioxygenase-like lactoylglutathione lyase family enzyme